MAATTKSTRRTSGGRNAESDMRKTTAGARKTAAGARKTAGRKTTVGRKTAAKQSAQSGGRKSGTKSSAEGRGRKASGGRSAEGTRGGGRSAATGGRKSAARTASPSRGKRAGKEEAGSRGRQRKVDALSLLKDDHEHVDELLNKFDRMKEGDERKQQLLEQILEEVRVHAQVEEELFYPALRTLLEEDGKEKELKLLAEADVEHETVKWLMAELEGGQLQSEMVDARVKVMGEYIRHHVEEEEGQIFRAAKRSDLDLEELGRQMDARKRELKGESGEPGEEGRAGAGMQGGMGTGSTRAVSPGTH